jgi:uncharacterized coiled-coil protein SlyX
MADRDDRLEERVAALERTITDGHAADGLPDAARMDSRLDDLEATVADLDDRLAELDAAVQALRGFAGGVRAVDEAVERRADAAVARVDRLEADLQAVRAELRDGAGDAADATAVRDSRERDGSHTTPHRTEQDAPARTDREDRCGRAMTARSDTGGRGNGHADHDGSPTADRSDRRPPWSTADGAIDGEKGVQQSAVTARTDAALAEAAAMADEPEGTDTDDDHTLAGRLRRLL